VKTISLKKVSAVAVASLGFGLLSVVPAQAGELPASQVTAVTTSAVTTAPVVGTAVFVKFGATFAALTADANNSADSTQFRAAITSFPTGGSVAITSNTAANATPAGTATPVAVTAGTAPTTAATASTNEVTVTLATENTTAWSAQTLTYLAGFNFTPTKTGVYEVTVWRDTDDADDIDVSEVRNSVSITVAAAPTLDLGLSTAFMTGITGGANASSTTNAVARTAEKAAGTQVAQVKVTLLMSDGNADTAAHTVTSDVSGVGYTTVNVTANTDPNVTTRSASNSAAASVRYVHIEADGTAGEGSVTVSVTHAVTGVKSTLGTFKYTTYADVAKLEVSTTNFTIGLAGGDSTGQADASRTAADNVKGALDDTTSAPAFIVKATDANGRVANAANAPTIVPSSTVVVASGTCVLDDGAVSGSSSGTGVGFYNCAFTTGASSKSGDKATLTIRIVDPADATKFITTTIDVTVGGSISTETIALDKTAYAPGEAMVITRTGKDSAGNPVADGSASPAVTFSKAVGGTAPAAGFYKGGVSASATSAAVSAVFAPTTPGAFQALMTSGNAAATKLSASASVTDANAALLTQIDALNAKIVALNALIAKIMKKLGVK